MGALTTHVLDTARGRPGAGIAITLYAVDADQGRSRVARFVTNRDGRTDAPLLDGGDFRAGVWELEFAVGEYFADSGESTGDPPFLDRVVIRFGIAEPTQHYHVPLLVSPWSYSTYRGS